MKTRKTGFFWAILFLVCSLCITTANAESGCAPCGSVITNNACSGPDATGVNPFLNYVATTDGQGGCYCPRDYFSGFYLGAGFGAGIINYNYQVSGATPPFIQGKNRSYLLGVVNGGFGWAFSHFYLGAEVGYNYRSRTNPITYEDTVAVLRVEDEDLFGIPFAESRPCPIKVDINSNHALTLDLTPGFVWSRFLGYLRLGVAQSDYNLTRRFCLPAVAFDVTVDPPGPFNATGDVDAYDFVFSKKLNSGSAYRLGLGFAVALNHCLSLRFDYIHTFGQKLTYTPEDIDFNPFLPTIDGVGPVEPDIESGNLLQDITIKPQRNEIVLGFRFKFFSF